MDSSFVTKAKTAFHTAAAKAERVLTEFKADLKADFGKSSSSIYSPVIQGRCAGVECKGELPWVAKTEAEKKFEDEIHKCILEISKKPEEFLCNQPKEDSPLDLATEMQSAGAILEYDEDLRNLRFHYVPKRMKEHEFWKCYFMAVNRVKQEVLSSEDRRDTVCSPDKCGWNEDAGTGCLEPESPKKDPLEEDAYKKAFSVVVLPSSILVKRLAAAVEVARSVNKVKDLEIMGKPEKDPSQGGEWPALVSGLAAMRKLSLRDSKDEKSRRSEEIQACLWSLFDTDTQANDAGAVVDGWCQATTSRIPEEIHGAPPGSFVAHLAEVMAGIRTEQRMAEFWSKVVSELRRHWAEGQPIPRIPVDANPDLHYCLLHQQLQVINCCISRQKRHAAELASLDALSEVQGCVEPGNISELDESSTLCSSQGVLHSNQNLNTPRLFVKGKGGQSFLRLGADCPAGNLRMLETGEQVYSPITQEGPVLTEELIKETEELVLRTGSVGAGCSQLLSDMQAFKAANPGCILEDFVRWYSPLDWRQEPGSGPSVEESEEDCTEAVESGTRGYLSVRMQSQGNLWQELWASAKPIPAAKQAPLFDEDLAGESTLDALEDIRPADLFEQLFKAVLGSGFAIAESAPLAKKEEVACQLKELKDFIISTCSKGMDAEKLEHLCQVYETMETIFQFPSEEFQDIRTLPSTDFDTAVAIPMQNEKGGKLYSNLIGIEGNLFRRLVREQQSSHSKTESTSGILSRILEAKASLFDKKSSKHPVPEDEKKSNIQESDWTLV